MDEKPFYLERNFYYKDKKDILKNEADGEELSVVYGDLSMLLGGIDKETFGNTYDIPQTGAVTGKELADILSEYLSNAAEGGGANIQVQKAKAALTARKKELAQEVRIIHEQKMRISGSSLWKRSFRTGCTWITCQYCGCRERDQSVETCARGRNW